MQIELDQVIGLTDDLQRRKSMDLAKNKTKNRAKRESVTVKPLRGSNEQLDESAEFLDEKWDPTTRGGANLDEKVVCAISLLDVNDV